ncbi:MAG: hypothetical protein P4L69_21105 [Desulfosporosinus sp.]|nr:hypothetical protein [Desulfosporosinus sp.]
MRNSSLVPCWLSDAGYVNGTIPVNTMPQDQRPHHAGLMRLPHSWRLVSPAERRWLVGISDGKV